MLIRKKSEIIIPDEMWKEIGRKVQKEADEIMKSVEEHQKKRLKK